MTPPIDATRRLCHPYCRDTPPSARLYEDPHIVLARLLEPELDRPVFANAVLGEDIRLVILDRPSSVSRNLEHYWHGRLQEIFQLAAERNPDSFYERLFGLGQTLENEGHLEQALRIYSTIVSFHMANSRIRENLSPARQRFVERAQERVSILWGRRPVSERLESIGRAILREVARPDFLLGMGAATVAFRTMRLTALARLLGGERRLGSAVEIASAAGRTPTQAVLSRARLFAEGAGIAAEAPTFVLTRRAAAAIIEEAEPNEAQPSLGEELASSYLNFGLFRLTPPLLSGGFSFLNTPNTFWKRLGREIFLQMGLCAAIQASFGLQRLLGLREDTTSGNDFHESTTYILAFNLTRVLSAPAFARTEAHWAERLGNGAMR